MNSSEVPSLSVVMPVHNALPYLDKAVTSILDQSYRHFEFVILDDGSTDGSLERLQDWAGKDGRIRLIEGGRCSGPVDSSNRVVRESTGSLVARMDADDLAAPDRLKRQIGLFDEPDVVLVGSTAETIDGQGRRVRAADLARLLRPTGFGPFAHPTIMFRREAFERVGGYREEAARWEDIDLYRRLAEIGRVLVIAEPLASCRLSEASTRLAISSSELERAMDSMYRSVAGTGGTSSGRLLPQAFLPGAVIRVWNGRRPRIFGRLLQLGDLGWNRSSAKMMAWAAWADFSPKSLRLVMRLLLTLRNRRARRLIGGAEVLEWRPPR